MELCDGHSSAKVFYKTLSRQSPREEPENVQSDSELGASTRADQEIVDVILSGRVSTSSVAFPSLRFPSLPNPPFLLFRPNITSSPPGNSRAAYASPTALSCSFGNLCVIPSPSPTSEFTNGPWPAA